jgi:hypothetical protein
MAHSKKASAEMIALTNKLASLLNLIVRFKELQKCVNSRSGCLLSAASFGAAVSSDVLEALANIVSHLLRILERLLNAPEGAEGLSDNLWDQLDIFFDRFFRFARLGLSSVSRRNQPQHEQEELERLAFVHWRWLCKSLVPLLQPLGWAELAEAVAKYQRLFDALELDGQSFSRLRSCLTTRLFPLPPQSIQDISLRSRLERLDNWSNLSGEAHILFLLQQGSQVKAILKDFAAGLRTRAEACDSLLDQKISFEGRNCHTGTSHSCSVAAFLGLQLAALRSRLSELSCEKVSAVQEDFLPIQLRLLLIEHPVAGGQVPSLEAAARLALHLCRNPAYDMVRCIEHNPLTCSLTAKPPTASGMTSSNLCEIQETLLENAGSLSLVTCEEKCGQLADAVKLLKGFQPEADPASNLWEKLSEELQGLLSGLSLVLNVSPPEDNSLESALQSLLSLEKIDPHLAKILTSLQQLYSSWRNEKKVLFHCYRLEVVLNLLKMHLFASLGAIDPAEKAALKYSHMCEQTADMETRIAIMDTFTAAVGTRHPHRPLLAARKEQLAARSAKRRNQLAERGGESFTSLSNAVRHFRTGVGAVGTVLELAERLDQLRGSGELGPALAEAEVWILSAHKFAANLMERYSPSFPGIHSSLLCLCSKHVLVRYRYGTIYFFGRPLGRHREK